MIKISKRIFEHTDLRIQEVRLLMKLSSGVRYNELNCKDKLWVMNSTSYSNGFFEDMIQHLVELGLLNSNYEPIIDSYIYIYISEDTKAKNLRQVFIECRANNSIVSVDVFKNLFGGVPKRVNEIWKATLKQTGKSYTWKEKHNKIYIVSN